MCQAFVTPPSLCKQLKAPCASPSQIYHGFYSTRVQSASVWTLPLGRLVPGAQVNATVWQNLTISFLIAEHGRLGCVHPHHPDHQSRPGRMSALPRTQGHRANSTLNLYGEMRLSCCFLPPYLQVPQRNLVETERIHSSEINTHEELTGPQASGPHGLW